MKARNFLLTGIITLLLSGCVVYSFYPLYTQKDLFANDILIGEWFEDENQDQTFFEGDSEWTFHHPFIGKKENGIIDSTAYILTLKTIDDKKVTVSKFRVYVIKLANQYFLDFYLEDFLGDEDITLASVHVVPVHSFAKLKVEEDTLTISWFDPEWMEDLIKENKIRIHHEYNDDFILLTAKPKELQKFVAKYVDSEEAFEDGLEVVLYRK